MKCSNQLGQISKAITAFDSEYEGTLGPLLQRTGTPTTVSTMTDPEEAGVATGLGHWIPTTGTPVAT